MAAISGKKNLNGHLIASHGGAKKVLSRHGISPYCAVPPGRASAALNVLTVVRAPDAGDVAERWGLLCPAQVHPVPPREAGLGL